MRFGKYRGVLKKLENIGGFVFGWKCIQKQQEVIREGTTDSLKFPMGKRNIVLCIAECMGLRSVYFSFFI